MIALIACCSPRSRANNVTNLKDEIRDSNRGRTSDHLAQEQRLAVQIITTDSGTTSDQANDSAGPKNQDRLDGQTKQPNESGAQDGSISFENQFKLMESQLSKTRHQGGDMVDSRATTSNQQQPLIPKRIVINLNTPGSNSSDSSGGPTKLTIGFAPTDPEDETLSGHKSKSGSDRSKAVVIPETRSSSVRSSPTSAQGAPARLQGRPSADNMRDAIMDGIRRQGGVPTFVMSSHEMGERNAEPQVKFMLNSEEVERHQSQSDGARSQAEVREPIRTSKSAASTRNLSLREQLDNLAGEIESVERKLGYAVNGERETNYGPFDMPVEDRSGRMSSAKRLFDDRMRGINRESARLSVVTNQLNGGFYPTRIDDRLPKEMTSNHNPRDNEVGAMATRERDASGMSMSNGVSRDEDDHVIMQNLDPIDHRNGLSMNQESRGGLNERLGRSPSVGGNLFISLESSSDNGQLGRGSRHPLDYPAGQQEQTNNNDDNRYHNYYGKSQQEGNLEKSSSENFENSINVDPGTGFAKMWRQRDSEAPLLMDNSNLFGAASFNRNREIVRAKNGDDSDEKSNAMSASAVNLGALNPARDEPASSSRIGQQGSGGNLAAEQVAAAGAARMGDRVVRMLDRLRLYTTKEQLMKVARDLQRIPNRVEPTTPARDNQANQLVPPGTIDVLQQGRLMSPEGQVQPTMKVSPEKKASTEWPTSKQVVADGRSIESAFSPEQYKLSLQRRQMARNQVPGPINYSPADTLLTMATSSDEQEQEPAPDSSQEDPTDYSSSDDGQTERKPDDGSGTRLLNEFRERQSRLRSLQDASARDASLESNENEVDSALANPTVPSGYTITDNAVHDYETTSSAANQINDHHDKQQSSDEHPNRSKPASSATDDQSSGQVDENQSQNEDTNDYVSNRDLIDVFKNNERLYASDSDESELPGGLTSSTNIKTQRFTPDGREIVFNNGVDDGPDTDIKYNDDEDGSDGMPIAPSEKEEQEIRALEQVIDELVEREKKEKKQRESEKK